MSAAASAEAMDVPALESAAGMLPRRDLEGQRGPEALPVGARAGRSLDHVDALHEPGPTRAELEHDAPGSVGARLDLLLWRVLWNRHDERPRERLVAEEETHGRRTAAAPIRVRLRNELER